MIAISLDRYALPPARAALRERVAKQRYDAAPAARTLALITPWNALYTFARHLWMPLKMGIRQKPRGSLMLERRSIGRMMLERLRCTMPPGINVWTL